MTTSVLKQDPNTKGSKERYLSLGQKGSKQRYLSLGQKGSKERYLSLGQKAFFQALDRKQLTAQPKTDVI